MVSERANYLRLSTIDEPFKIISRGNDKVSDHIKDEYVAPGTSRRIC